MATTHLGHYTIDNDLWYIVEHGVPIVTTTVSVADVKKFKQLDSQAKNIICGHVSKGQYGRVSALGSAKLIWERLSKVNEGVSTQRDSRVDVLRNLFNRFKRLDNGSCQDTFDRLTDISNELQALGARDITDHEVVKKLLRSLDSTFDTLVLRIQETLHYKMLHRADILKRLNTHEFQKDEKRDLYGPSYSRPRALKAKAISSSEEKDLDGRIGDPEEFGQELVMLVRKFQKFTRRGQFGKSSRRDMRKSESSSEDYKKRTCHKCNKSGHYIVDCPRWGKESKKRKYKDESSDDSKKKKKSSKSSSSKSLLHKKTSFRKAWALIGKEMIRRQDPRNVMKRRVLMKTLNMDRLALHLQPHSSASQSSTLKKMDSHTYRVFNNYHNKVVETVDVRFDETNGSQREQLPPDPDKLSPEEAIKLKATKDIVPTEEIDEEIIPSTDENQEDAPEEIAP
ncbi:hypothetical protein ZWY2020_011061 [Hordeum vulgare]|nr:hypothetical protein ZWY2020_011061 [Hordeum vulgare]